MFEPTHGSAPKYAGKDYVNPGSEILSAEMMLRHLGWKEAADVIIRATEAFTRDLPGGRRRYLRIYSHMLQTEVLPDHVWDELGWANCEPIADQRYHFFYAQREAAEMDIGAALTGESVSTVALMGRFDQ